MSGPVPQRFNHGLAARVIHPERAADSAVSDDVGFLAGHGFSRKQLTIASHLAAIKQIPASEWMILRGLVSRNDYLALLARHIGVDFEDRPPGKTETISVIAEPAHADEACTTAPPISTAIVRRESGTRFIAAPTSVGQRMPAYLASVDSHRKVALMPQPVLRLAVHERQSVRWMRQACSGLAEALPQFSARRRLSAGQALTGLLALIGGTLGAVYLPTVAIAALGGILTLYYLATIVLRLHLLGALKQTGPDAILPETRPDPEDFPTYSVLVALRDEANQVGDLVIALQKLDWPPGKLEIFLVCEADDAATIDAIRSLSLPGHINLVQCPPSKPRTKPKALNYALPLCTGKFVVIYDAEDRPHTRQLIEAWFAFAHDESGRLACLQAPLSIHNHRRNWLTQMFAIEYDTLFHGMLPVLASKAAPMPLGGTSNHFRADLLRRAGGWDPYNVTEDADLGIRLARMGYRCGTLRLATQEEAPQQLWAWLKQRTRWLKGWMQTILVHTRNPIRTAGELGARSNLYFHLILTAIVMSMLAHPLFLVHTGWWLAELVQGRAMGPVETAFFFICVANLAGGYLAYGLFASAVIGRLGDNHSRWMLLTLPLYWLLISIAGWRALLHLVFSPFRWEKTAHGLAKPAAKPNIGDKELP